MASVTNLVPLVTARRKVGELLEQHGIEYFTMPELDRPPLRLDPEVLLGIIEDACQGCSVSEEDRQVCFRVLRRELILELAVGLVLSGY